MNPKAVERGLRLRWIEATEIHPELRDENATMVNVGNLSLSLMILLHLLKRISSLLTTPAMQITL